MERKHRQVCSYQRREGRDVKTKKLHFQLSIYCCNDECYGEDIKLCEDGGTPGIVQAIRTRVAFEIKDLVGNDRIAKLEHKYFELAMDSWLPNLKNSHVGTDRPYYQSHVPIFFVQYSFPGLIYLTLKSYECVTGSLLS